MLHVCMLRSRIGNVLCVELLRSQAVVSEADKEIIELIEVWFRLKISIVLPFNEKRTGRLFLMI